MKRVEVKVVDHRVVVEAKGLMSEDVEALNGLFGEAISFKPNEKDDVVEIRSTSPKYTAVQIAAELEDLGFPWENPQNLGCKVHPVQLKKIAGARLFSARP